MYQNNTITYKDTPIYTINDLVTLIESERQKKAYFTSQSNNQIYAKDDSVKPKLDKMLLNEIILSQQVFPPTKRSYTFANMLQTQSNLEALDFLETAKYATNIVSARQLLHQYLYSKYNFSACTSLLQDNSIKKDIMKPNDKIVDYKNLFQFIEQKSQPSRSKSIRQYLNNYLSEQMDSNMQSGLYSSKANYVKDADIEPQNSHSFQYSDSNIKTRFFLPIYEIPEFLLRFSFFDGRDFSHSHSQKNPDKLPTIKNPYSEFSYQIVLDKAKELYSSPSNWRPFTISTLYRCDTIFLFQKLKRLKIYYNMYQSPSILTKIMKKYQISYIEVESLKKSIIDNIFRDKDFIIFGLRSKYLDFMLPFDIYFQYLLYAIPDYSITEHTLTSFEKNLKQIKNDTLEIITNDLHLLSFENIFFFKKNGDFSINENELRICEQLKKNDFYNCYYLHEDNNSFTEDTYFLDFETIKKALT